VSRWCAARELQAPFLTRLAAAAAVTVAVLAVLLRLVRWLCAWGVARGAKASRGGRSWRAAACSLASSSAWHSPRTPACGRCAPPRRRRSSGPHDACVRGAHAALALLTCVVLLLAARPAAAQTVAWPVLAAPAGKHAYCPSNTQQTARTTYTFAQCTADCDTAGAASCVGVTYDLTGAQTACYFVSGSSCAFTIVPSGASYLPWSSYFRVQPQAADALAGAAYTTGCLDAGPWQNGTGSGWRYVRVRFGGTPPPQLTLYSDAACSAGATGVGNTLLSCTNLSSTALGVFSTRQCALGVSGFDASFLAAANGGAAGAYANVAVVAGASEALLSYSSPSVGPAGYNFVLSVPLASAYTYVV
jgi:hypothetical protein